MPRHTWGAGPTCGATTERVHCHAVILYYITDRRQFGGDESARRKRLLTKIAEAAQAGVDFVQLRERDLAIRELERLAREAAEFVAEANSNQAKRNGGRETGNGPTRLLINSRTDIALVCGADGVHLRSDDITAADARAIWISAGTAKQVRGNGIFAVSGHSVTDVRLAEAHGADLAVFAPVFEKSAAPQRAGVGLSALAEACRGVSIPVLALGGVTAENARACLAAGAAGIAAIRLFQEHEMATIVAQLRRPAE